MHIEDTQYIKSARHNIHTSRDFDQMVKYVDIFNEEADELAKEYNIKPLHISVPEYMECDNDDCDMECSECKEMEYDYWWTNKEKINTEIEEWMRAIELQFGLDEDSIAPSGMARMRWIESA